MNIGELTRLEIVQKVISKQLKVREGASLLGIGERQLKRLTSTYRHEGAPGLVSKQRGKPSNNQVGQSLRTEVMALVSSKYEGFGPTLACEKLLEKEGLKVSKETLRQWMKAGGLWQPKRRRQPKVHQLRTRRSCFGELVQIDGSPHDWFEGRRGACCLLVFIDDATSRIQHLRFEEKEPTFGYFEATRGYIKEHGLPLSFYSDKHSIFRVNQPESKRDELTQFGRAVKDLDIESICANTPQAKGRVERASEWYITRPTSERA